MTTTCPSGTAAFANDHFPISADKGQPTEALSGTATLATHERLPDWSRQVDVQIGRFASLRENWDSYGASIVDPRAIGNAQTLIQYLSWFVGVERPAVGATPDGDVGFSWDGGVWSLDVEATSAGVFNYVYLHEAEPSREVEGSTTDANDILLLLTSWK